MTQTNPTAKFCITPQAVIDADISDRAKVLFAVMQSYLSGRAGHSFPSRARLAERLRCSRDSVDRAILELEAIGAIEVITQFRDSDGGQTSNEYRLLFDDLEPQESGGGAAPMPRGGRKVAQGEPHRRGSKNKTHSTRPKYQDPIKARKSSTSETQPEDGVSEAEIVDMHRVECERLANLLADLIAADGSKRPRVSKDWIDVISRMIRLDRRTPQEVEGAIRWCQADDFWSVNILCPKKLRSQFDRLYKEAGRKHKGTKGNSGLTTIQRLHEEALLQEQG